MDHGRIWGLGLRPEGLDCRKEHPAFVSSRMPIRTSDSADALPSTLRFKVTDAIPFAVVAALARLGHKHKYQLDGLLAESIRRLKSAFPCDLADWDARPDGNTALLPVEPTDAIEAFNLLRRIGQQEMLPAALYGCAQLDCGVLLRGVTRADGKTLEKLDEDDLALCLRVQRELTTRNVKLALSLFAEGCSPQCARTTGCEIFVDIHSTEM
ncbi:hypothetical protein C8Q76DRAFT_801009 [Earliella scabrosa]|nr:hypothetical protein C8Q76DRAFT_801009 [Earliella scabrosa]